MDITRIRPIAVCLFRHENRVLVSEGFDSVKQNYYFRPLGGGIEYGETSRDAVVREIREELGAEIENVKLLGVLENIFVYEGEQGHEIVFVFDGEFVEKSLYERGEIDGYEQEAGIKFKTKWFLLDKIRENGGRLVPEGLFEMIMSESAAM